jgi:DNA-binding MarR family transcriptional regulator
MTEESLDEQRTAKVRTLHARPGYLIRRTHQIALALFMETAGEYKITPTQFGIMHILNVLPGSDQGTVAKLLGHDRSSTALAVSNLQSRGMLERRLEPDDRRKRILFLSKAGSELFATASEQLVRMQNKILSPFTPEEQSQFMSLLQKLVGNFDAVDGDGDQCGLSE